MKTKMKINGFLKEERKHRCRKVKCRYGCENGKEFQKRNTQGLYIMPYISGYERIHGLNKFAVYKYGWNNRKDSTTEIKIANVKIRRWVRLEEPLRI